MERYKGCLIARSAVPRFATGFDWDSHGIIFRSGRPGSIVEIKRIKGPIVNSKDAAEETGSSCARIGLTTVLTVRHHGDIGPVEEKLYATIR